LIPGNLLKIFDARELELMISGMPDIDLIDLRNNTEYINYTKDSQVIKWFWEVLESFDRSEKANFLQFVTGSSKVPIEGFKSLKGMGGNISRFQIHKVYNKELLPTAHTW
jgi:E3 ubiquitin-protein ligase HUWE1